MWHAQTEQIFSFVKQRRATLTMTVLADWRCGKFTLPSSRDCLIIDCAKGVSQAPFFTVKSSPITKNNYYNDKYRNY